MPPAVRSMSAGTLVSSTSSNMNSNSSHPSSSRVQKSYEETWSSSHRRPSEGAPSTTNPSLTISTTSRGNIAAQSNGSADARDRYQGSSSHDRIHDQRPFNQTQPVSPSTVERYGGPVRHTGPSKHSGSSSSQSQSHSQSATVQQNGSTSAPTTPTRPRQDSAPKLPPLSFEKEALQYQLKLHQKPPRQGGGQNGHDDEDSED
ncbi:hypothetical protein BGZ94_002127, partial [Podila epigama]